MGREWSIRDGGRGRGRPRAKVILVNKEQKISGGLDEWKTRWNNNKIKKHESRAGKRRVRVGERQMAGERERER